MLERTDNYYISFPCSTYASPDQWSSRGMCSGRTSGIISSLVEADFCNSILEHRGGCVRGWVCVCVTNGLRAFVLVSRGLQYLGSTTARIKTVVWSCLESLVSKMEKTLSKKKKRKFARPLRPSLLERTVWGYITYITQTKRSVWVALWVIWAMEDIVGFEAPILNGKSVLETRCWIDGV